jgi:hypothetical protein
MAGDSNKIINVHMNGARMKSSFVYLCPGIMILVKHYSLAARRKPGFFDLLLPLPSRGQKHSTKIGVMWSQIFSLVSIMKGCLHLKCHKTDEFVTI